MNGDLFDYAKWYLEEEEYFISKRGSLIARYPKSKEHIITRYVRVHGFRFYIPLSYATIIKLYNNGKQIERAPRDVTPIKHYQVR